MKRIKNWPWGYIAYFSWAAVVLSVMIWHDTHLPNCLRLYGEQYHPKSDVWADIEQSNRFISCQDQNMASVFGAQFFGIVGATIVPLLGSAAWELVAWLWRKVARRQ